MFDLNHSKEAAKYIDRRQSIDLNARVKSSSAGVYILAGIAVFLFLVILASDIGWVTL